MCGPVCGFGAPLSGSVLDLSAEPADGKFITRLDGAWEFYPNDLPSGRGFAGFPGSGPGSLADVPSAWTLRSPDASSASDRGVGTYRRVIRPPKNVPVLGLQIREIRSAYRLWINREVVASSGTVSVSATGERAMLSADLIRFSNDSPELEIILEVSNHRYPSGGIVSPILFGDADSLEHLRFVNRAVVLVALSMLTACAWFNLCFYLYHRRTKVSLFLGLFILACVANFASSSASGWMLRLFDRDVSAEWLSRIEYLCLFLTIPTCYSFMLTTFPEEFSGTLERLLWPASLALGGVALAVPVVQLLQLLPTIYVGIAGLAAYAWTRLLKARRRHREGGALVLLGFSVLAVVAVNDMLHDLRIVTSDYFKIFGTIFFVVTLELWVITTFSRSLVKVQRLTRQLKAKNSDLLGQIRERQRLETEIIRISEEERRAVSRDLHDGICQDLVAAKLFCSTLEKKTADLCARLVTGNRAESYTRARFSESMVVQIRQLYALLERSVNRAYDLSRGLWPIESDKSGTTAFLEEFCRRTSAANHLEITFHRHLKCASCVYDNMPQLFRIAQEAINNAVRHAQADRIEVELDCVREFPQLYLTVRDDGIGRQRSAHSTQGGMGMKIMAYRAQMIGGKVFIYDGAQCGTTVSCRVECGCCPKAAATSDMTDSRS